MKALPPGGWKKVRTRMNDHDRSLVELSAFLAERLKRPLPGPDAHSAMFPVTKENVRLKFESPSPARRGSVLILLYEDEGGVFFPLIKRPAYTGVHGGQISLPGGKAEEDETAVQTALREGEEEIGIDARKVTTVGTLTAFNVLVSNIFITPVVGVYRGVPAFRPDPHEVERVLVYPLSELLNQDEILKREILSSGSVPLIAPHFAAGEEIVWGATAMVLNEFRVVLRGG